MRTLSLALLALGLGTVAGCHTLPPPGTMATPRRGDEIVVAGQFVHTGTQVVLWLDPGGYDAYRVERRFSPLERADWDHSLQDEKDLTSPNRYGLRRNGLSAEQLERVRGGGWDLPALQRVVDQFVIHFDVCGTSRECFRVLQDKRDLSVHFMLDLDGTIYQTLDLKERAWHATTSNTRSVGIEIANMGAYGPDEHNPLQKWYAQDAAGGTHITIPPEFGNGGIRTPHFVGHPERPGLVHGTVQGRDLVQYNFTPEQYQALTKLTAALCKIFPKMQCDYPRDSEGKLLNHKLPDDELSRYHGVLGHYHIQTDKVDPGPAFQWDRVLDEARRMLHGGFSDPADQTSKGHLHSYR
jgi:N-acetyl-anhydromuramyl-L-alanine amidase AmpD